MQPNWADLEKVVEYLKKKLGDDLIALALFGSAARGEMHERSDVDILLIAKKLPEKRYERMKCLSKGRPFVGGHRVGTVPYTKEEFLSGFPSFYLDLGLDTKILYDTDGFLAGKLERIREITKESDLARIKCNGEMMWVWTKPPWIRNYHIDWESYREF